MLDTQVRSAAFSWLADQVDKHGDVLPHILLEKGSEWRGQRVTLMGRQGIRKPKILPEMSLSITTSPNSPYDDSFEPDDCYATVIEVPKRRTTPLHDFGSTDSRRHPKES